MLAMLSLVIGILLAILVMAIYRNQPTALPWWTLALGLAGAAALMGAMWLNSLRARLEFPLWNLSILLSFAAVIVGIQTLRRGQRGWASWAGLVAGLTVAGFWVWFAIGSLMMGG